MQSHCRVALDSQVVVYPLIPQLLPMVLVVAPVQFKSALVQPKQDLPVLFKSQLVLQQPHKVATLFCQLEALQVMLRVVLLP